jgi:hypothetical protein
LIVLMHGKPGEFGLSNIATLVLDPTNL